MLPDSRTIWLSRSCAVAITILVLHNKEWYVALAQRGPKAADFHGMWCLPCGYMDWDEMVLKLSDVKPGKKLGWILRLSVDWH